MPTREDLLQQVLELPSDDQVTFAHELDAHLMAKFSARTPDVAEFRAELHRRSAAYRTGAMSARDAADVMADLELRQAHETQP